MKLTLCILALFFCKEAVEAQNINIKNASFESPKSTESTNVDDWYESRSGGLVGGYVVSPSRKDDIPDTPHGTQWLELIGQPNQPGDVYQQIGVWKEAGYCNVSFLLGNRQILSKSNISAQLWAGGDVNKAKQGVSPQEIGARLLSSADNVGLPANGKTRLLTLSLASGKKGKVGEPLWLRFVQRGELQVNAVALIDNVLAEWSDQPVKSTSSEKTVRVIPAYTVQNISAPSGVVIEAGGVCHWPDGTLVVATRRGEVWTIRDGNWNRFATGLMGPMGIWSDKIGEVYVTEWAGLTRLLDLDGDLAADRYETVTAAWEMPGSRTDFVYGLCRAK